MPTRRFGPASREAQRYARFLREIGAGHAPNWSAEALAALDTTLDRLDHWALPLPVDAEDAQRLATSEAPDWRAQAAQALEAGGSETPQRWKTLWHLLRLADPLPAAPAPTLPEMAARIRSRR